MNLFQPCDIVFASFPFEEGIEQSKVRPVLILSRRTVFGQYKVAKITSTPHYGEMKIPQGGSSGLSHDSWLDMRQIAYIHETDIMYKIGVFPEELAEKFKQYLIRLKKEIEYKHRQEETRRSRETIIRHSKKTKRERDLGW